MGMKKIRNAAIIACAICLVLNIIWKVARTDIVVNVGVRTWRTGRMALAVVLCVLVVIAVLATIRCVVAVAKQRRGESERIAKETAAAEPETGPLSMKGTLDALTMRKMLLNAVADGGWRELEKTADECARQTEKMETCRKKLHRLLVENDAQRLDNTEDALAQAEQYMLQNVRKVVNCMQACDRGDPEGCDKTTKQTETCLKDNGKRLEQVQDLIDAVTDFLNSQGQDDTTMDTLDAYRKTILESIN